MDWSNDKILPVLLAAVFLVQEATAQVLSEDRHWIQPDDYFISRDAYEQGMLFVHLGQMQQPGTAQTNDAARFLRLTDAREIWTKYFWKTRPAEAAELKPGTLALCFVGNQSGDFFLPPADKQNARTGDWILGRITAMVEGNVQIGRIRCSPDTIRLSVDPIESVSGTARSEGGVPIRVEPSHGAPGDVVRIFGEGFGPRSGRSFVTIGAVKAPILLWEEGKILVWVPGGAPSGSLSVTVNGHVVAEAPFMVEGEPIGEGEGRQRGLKIWKAAKRLFGIKDKKTVQPAPPGAGTSAPSPSPLLPSPVSPPPAQATLPPSIEAISPAAVTIGDAGFTLTVTGKNFDSTAKILWAYSGQTPSTPAITPTFKDSSTLTVQVTQSSGGFAFPSGSSDFTPHPGALMIQVVTLGPNFREQRSNTVSLTIFSPSPVLSSISGGCRANLNCTPANGFPVRITGSGFVNNLVNGSQPSTYAEINGRPTPVSLVGERPVAGQMELLVNGSLIPTAGMYSVKVCNVGTAQGTSCSTGSLTVSGGPVAGVIPAAASSSAQVPTRVLSPVRGRFHINLSGQRLSPLNKWSFWQHKSGPHGVGGGIGRADDTNAWDMNVATEGNPDADKGRPVFAVAKGTVALTYAGCPHAGGGSFGAVLVDHGGWWTGYLHMDGIRVKPGQPVDDTTPLGVISNRGVPDKKNHLHFVVYTGTNLSGCLSNPTSRGLTSVNVELISR